MVNAVVGFLVGIILGSFIDCIASRVLTNKSFFGRSYCLRCERTLRWYDLIPLVSYIALQRKCRSCQAKIPLEVFIVEIISGICVALIFYTTPPFSSLLNFSFSGIRNFFPLFDLLWKIYVFCILFIVVITDLKEGVIPNRIIYPAIFTIIAYAVSLDALKIYLLFNSLNGSEFGRLLLSPPSDFFLRHTIIILEPLFQSFIAAAFIALFFWGVIYFTKGRGMGGGDLTLGVFIGLSIGFPNAFFALLISFILGSVVGISLVLSKKKSIKQTIPFGPFLSLGSMIALLWGKELVEFYLSIKGF